MMHRCLLMLGGALLASLAPVAAIAQSADSRVVITQRPLPLTFSTEVRPAAEIDVDVTGTLAVGQPAPLPLPGNAASPVETFCANIADAAADARYLAQKKELERLEAELEKRLVLLEKKTAEFRDWLARRDAFANTVRETLTGIYAKMKPEAAASHLTAMDEETAAALLLKLNIRQASAILNEMPPDRAARLAMIVSGAGAVPKPDAGSTPRAEEGDRG